MPAARPEAAATAAAAGDVLEIPPILGVASGDTFGAGAATPSASSSAPEPGSLAPPTAAAAAVAAVIAAATASFCLFASRLSLRSSRRSAEFHRFLIWLSVRPGSALAMSAHLLPIVSCALRSFWSSSSVQSPLLMIGSR